MEAALLRSVLHTDSSMSGDPPRTEIAYVNGRFLPMGEATIGIEDRGLQFADSVYEVILVSGGLPVDAAGHYDRLFRSMAGLGFERQPTRESIEAVVGRLITENRTLDGMVYIQVTSGAAPRVLLPRPAQEPTVIAYARPLTIGELDPAKALAIASVPDIRWGRCDIKTTALVANALTRLRAQQSNADDAWLVDRDGFVTESSASNAWIVKNGTAQTRPAGPDILSGITRERVMLLAAAVGIKVIERKFSVSECLEADEAFITSATALLTPVKSIDGTRIGNKLPGPVTKTLYDSYLAFIQRRR